ncbi:MAG: L-threonylcarbamoyladenylate synthase [Gammaproteobacteria bacterium]|nr:L-threonylcarbamoyladenylate synthase [Gammaproteobacteria bacterium]
MSLAPFQARIAAQVLRDGGLIAYPTEAVFGLGCDPFDEAAVLNLLEVKRRPLEKGLILIAADFNQLSPWLRPVDAQVMARIQPSWPGPHTWILPANDDLPEWITGAHEGVAVRVTAHPVAAELCRAFGGPIVSTSANLSGLTPARCALQVEKQLGGLVDLVIHGEVNRKAKPSQIRDALTGKILRM